MRSAAAAFLASLDSDRFGLAAWPFPGGDERLRWFYTPTDHGGVALSDLGPRQQQLAFRLVSSGLSRAGYATVATIVGLENVLDELEGWTARFEHERGRDPGRYYVRVFGDPARDRTWAWRFGGHHVSINHTVVDGASRAATPCFLGADPARSPLLGPHPLRPLAGAEDLGRELVCSLDDDQRARAVVAPVAPIDIVSANRPRVGDGDLPLPLSDVWRDRFGGELGEGLRSAQEHAERHAGLTAEHLDAVRLSTGPIGVAARSLDRPQQDRLRALLDVYLGRIPDAWAEEEAAKYRGPRLGELTFAWAGSVTVGDPHYYRIQGPRLLVEYDNTQRGANHVHTVWRDPEGDFGMDVLGDHVRTSH